MIDVGWLVVVFVIALLAFIVWGLSALALRRSPRPIVPQCGRCGYPVAGLPTHICPECGSDHREVGIRTQAMVAPRDWGWFGLLAKAGVWSLAVFVVFQILEDAVYRYVDQATLSTQTRTLGNGQHPKLERMIVTQERLENTRGLMDRTDRITLMTASGKAIRVEVDAATREVVARVGERKFTYALDSLSEEDVAIWYDAAGEPIDAREDPLLAHHLVKCIQVIVDHPAYRELDDVLMLRFSSSGWNSGSKTVTDRTLVYVANTIMAAVWLAGIAWILLRRRKRDGVA